LAGLAGCNRSPSTTERGRPESEAKPTLIAEADREHDFGAVIANSGRKVKHRYRLRNDTRRDIKILNVINRKTCCGIVQADAPTLHSGDATEIGVTLLVGDRFGRVVHEAEVVTDSPDESSLVFRTEATAVPPIRIEEVAAFDRTIIIGAKEPRLAAFRVYASGTAAEHPIDLDRVELRSTTKVDWAGPKESSPAEDGLQVESRRFIAALDPTGPPGEHRAEVLLQEGNRIVGRHIVSWEVVSPIVASPKVVVIRSGQRECRVIIRSRDQRPFRIKRVECAASGVKGRASSATAALAQTVYIEGVLQSKDHRGSVTVLTDHPLQEKVELPLLVID
jgi:hypothetical protein